MEKIYRITYFMKSGLNYFIRYKDVQASNEFEAKTMFLFSTINCAEITNIRILTNKK